MSKRCDLTELYVEQCAHCRGLPDTVPYDPEVDIEYGVVGDLVAPRRVDPVPARYPSTCLGACRAKIWPGEYILPVDSAEGTTQGWVHVGCEEG